MSLSDRNAYEVHAELLRRIERLEAEIERLRAALQEIAEHPSPYSEQARRVAHDALDPASDVGHHQQQAAADHADRGADQ